MILWVSILHLASSWISRSVSYRDRNSAMHTQMKVVCSWERGAQERTVRGGVRPCPHPFKPLTVHWTTTHRIFELFTDRADDR
jgi:hypothetical protein